MKSSGYKVGRVAIAVTATALLAALAGCSGGGAGDKPSSGGGDVDGSTITIGTFSPLASQFQAYADAYTKKFPKRTVKVVGVSEDFTKYQQILATERLSGTLPDIFFNVDFAADSIAASDIPLDLAANLKSAKDDLATDAFIPQFLDQYRPLSNPDEVLGLPVSADSTALVYNETLFDQAGVTEYPTDDWTWDDYFRVAQEIQEKSQGKIYGTVPPASDGSVSVAIDPILNAMGVTIYDSKSNKVDFTSDPAIEAWNDMLQFYGKGSAAYTTTAGDPGYDFTSGKVAMGITSRANIAGFREALKSVDWDVAQIPTVNGKHPSGGGSYAMSVAQTTKNANAAWAFLAWFYEPHGGLAIAQTEAGGGIIPPTVEGIESGEWKNVEVPEHMAIFADSAKGSFLTLQLPGDVGNTKSAATKEAFQEVLLNGADVKDAFQKAEDTVNQALAKQK